mmetsp:Transcript_13408/g.31918  ORF Transcript_13408/g.31918 Transcript_13408/m.31918 type:complete len:252 (+) Transcript_13408:3075-3830(+)
MHVGRALDHDENERYRGPLHPAQHRRRPRKRVRTRKDRFSADYVVFDQLPKEASETGPDEPARHEEAARERGAVGHDHEREVRERREKERRVAEGLVRVRLRHHPRNRPFLSPEQERSELVVLASAAPQPHAKLLVERERLALTSAPFAVAFPAACKAVVFAADADPPRGFDTGCAADRKTCAVVCSATAPVPPVVSAHAGPRPVASAAREREREVEDHIGRDERHTQDLEHFEEPACGPHGVEHRIHEVE